MPHRDGSILLIEDDLSLSDCLRQFLGDHGYRMQLAATAKQGWELLQRHAPRLCLLDLNLPDGSGLELLKKMVFMRMGVKVVVMTAFDLRHLRPAETDGILVAWMTKPVQPLELLNIVDTVMAAATSPG